MLDLVFIWLKEHSLIVLLLLGTIFNVFWLYRMRRQLQMKWYAVIAFSVLHTVCGVLSVKAFAFLETGDAGNMSLFGGVFFMPVLYFISAKVSKRNIKAVFDIFTICMIFTVMCARVNCIVSGCCAGLVIPGTHVHFPTRELEILYYIVMLILLIPRVKKSMPAILAMPCCFALQPATCSAPISPLFSNCSNATRRKVPLASRAL